MVLHVGIVLELPLQPFFANSCVCGSTSPRSFHGASHRNNSQQPDYPQLIVFFHHHCCDVPKIKPVVPTSFHLNLGSRNATNGSPHRAQNSTRLHSHRRPCYTPFHAVMLTTSAARAAAATSMPRLVSITYKPVAISLRHTQCPRMKSYSMLRLQK